MKILLKGGRLIDPSQGLDAVGDLLVDGETIAACGAGASAEAGGATVIDVAGLVVAPGLIDMHVHLREPGREDEETIASGTRAAVAGGFTAVVSMANTQPVVEGEEGVRFVLAKAREAGAARVHPVAAVTQGQKGELLSEMGAAARAGAVAFSDDGSPVANSGLMRRALEYAGMLAKPVISHCEDPGLAGRGVMNEGAVSTRLGLRGIPVESETVAVARDTALARLTRAPLHIAHVSAAGSLDLVREAKQLGARVTCEVTPHNFTLADAAVEGYGTNTKMKPPLRTERDIAALRHALRTGLADAIASDHAPHSVEEKDQEFDVAPFGIVGLETSLGLALTELYHKQVVPLPDLVRLMSTNPARILGLSAGTLGAGAPADVTVFDPEARWTVDPARFLSKSRNTPFSGWQLKGKAITVIVNGRVLLRDGEIAA